MNRASKFWHAFQSCLSDLAAVDRTAVVDDLFGWIGMPWCSVPCIFIASLLHNDEFGVQGTRFLDGLEDGYDITRFEAHIVEGRR